MLPVFKFIIISSINKNVAKDLPDRQYEYKLFFVLLLELRCVTEKKSIFRKPSIIYVMPVRHAYIHNYIYDIPTYLY